MRKKLLYASPFPPLKSGISDYSVVLVNALSRLLDVTLLIDDYDINLELKKRYPILKNRIDTVDFDRYDFVLYNMGNNIAFHSGIYETAIEHPGFIIWHDLSIFHFIYEYYSSENRNLYTELYERFGLENFIDCKKAIRNQTLDLKFASSHPMLEEILFTDNKLIVHSQYARDRILVQGKIKSSNIKKINMIAQVGEENRYLAKDELLEKFNVPKDSILICSFGYIQQNKMNYEICEVVKKISKHSDQKICYVMVGSGDYVDDLIEDNLIIKTGYTELDEFNSFIRYSDIVMNLRNPTMGETSAALMRAMQMGKPSIVSNHGWYAELPDEAVIKISVDDSYIEVKDALISLIDDVSIRKKMGLAAKLYIEKECNPKSISDQIYNFLMSYHK